jgi:hypothetical protein
MDENEYVEPLVAEKHSFAVLVPQALIDYCQVSMACAVDEDAELQEVKEALKCALLSGDTAALLAAEREIIRIRKIKGDDGKHTFLHEDSGNLVAWGEPEGPVQYSG